MRQLGFILILLLLVASFSPLTTLAEEQIERPSVSSEAAVLLDANTGSILYEKNSNAKMYPASLTKIATAIYAIEKGNLDDIVTVSKKAREVDGTRVYLEEGEQVPLRKLIQGMLINSGNDAGIAIAEHMEGSTEAFASKLNKYLIKKVGVKDTHFANPHGLFEEDHYTTAHDMAVITQYALKNKLFTEIYGTKQLDWVGTGWQTTIYSHHQLLRERPYDGIIGGKTGYTGPSQHTLSTAAERGELKLVAIVLKADTQKIAYDDTVNLLDFGFENFEISVIPETEKFMDKNKAEYIVKKPIKYVHLKNEATKTSLDNSGVLVVNGDDGRQLAKVKLTKKEEKVVKKDDKSLKQSQQEGTSTLFTLLFVLVPLMLTAISAFLYQKRKRILSLKIKRKAGA